MRRFTNDYNADGSAQAGWTERQVVNAVNESCSCGGKGPDDGCCQACEVWHRLHGLAVDTKRLAHELRTS